MSNRWERFFDDAVRRVLAPGARVLDVGNGLRADGSRGNVVDARRAWMKPLIAQADYRVMDPVDTYHPDIVGDVMDMPLPNASEDAIICLSVLEHVPRPWDAVREMRRVLRPGGTLLLYIPFLSAYHAMPGYYGDYVRFTEDGMKALLEGMDDVRIVPVRGPAETIAHLVPARLGASVLRPLGRFMDRFWNGTGKQASGYYAMARQPGSQA